jgi:predicted small lipoprotein YifL
MRPFLAIAALLSLAACGQQQAAPPPGNETAALPEAKPAETPKLDGDWSVVAIDGKPVEGAGMAASFAAGRASLSAGCVRRAFAYTQKRNVVSFTANPAGSSNCEGQGASAEQATASDALQQASIVIFNEDGSEADLSGTGGNLKLRRR